MRTAPLTVALTRTHAAKFWSRVDKTGGCWIWIGTRDVHGYGAFYVEARLTVKAHRLSWVIANGLIPSGLFVFLGDARANGMDMERKGRGRHPGGEATKAAVGERSINAKFTWDQVRSIRAEHRTGTVSIGALARRYGVSNPTISLMVRGKTWTHEPGEPWKPSNSTVARYAKLSRLRAISPEKENSR